MRPLSSSDLSALSRYPLSLQQAALALWGVDKDAGGYVAPGQSVAGEGLAKTGRVPVRAK